MPDFENVLFKPQPEERPATKPEPFSFEERDKGKPTRESFVEMILRKEKVRESVCVHLYAVVDSKSHDH